MKPRQIKKNSKSAMGLLIKLFGFKQKEFFLDADWAHSCWSVFTSHGDYYCEDGGAWMSAIDMLAETYVMHDCTWQECPKTYFSFPVLKRKRLYGIELIKECRKLAKAGVKFR